MGAAVGQLTAAIATLGTTIGQQVRAAARQLNEQLKSNLEEQETGRLLAPRITEEFR